MLSGSQPGTPYAGKWKHVGSRAGIITAGAKSGSGLSTTLAANEKVATRSRHLIHGRPLSLYLDYYGVDIGNGTVERSMPIGGYVARRVTVSSGGGGSGHAVGNVVTLGTTAAETAAKVRVVAVSAGAITKVVLVTGGYYRSVLADGTAQSATTGSGTGASFDVEWEGVAAYVHASIEFDFDNPITTGPNANTQLVTYLDDDTLTPDIIVRPGQFARSGLFKTPITRDAQPIAIRTYATGTGLFQAMANNTATEKYSKGTGTGDITSGTSAQTGGAFGYIYPPALIMGWTTKPTTCVAILGTSQEMAQDIDDGDAPDFDNGYPARACTALGFPYIKMPRSGSTITNFKTRPDGRLRMIERGAADVVYMGDNGVNTFNGSATTAAAVLDDEKLLNARIRAAGARYIIGNYSTPLVENSGLTDPAGQTLKALNNCGQRMLDRNALLDLNGPAFYGYDELFDNRLNEMTYTGSASNPTWTGFWQAPGGVALTTDGTHRTKAWDIATTLTFRSLLARLSLPSS